MSFNIYNLKILKGYDICIIDQFTFKMFKGSVSSVMENIESKREEIEKHHFWILYWNKSL